MKREKIIYQEKFNKRQEPLKEPEADKIKKIFKADEVYVEEQGVVERGNERLNTFVLRVYAK